MVRFKDKVDKDSLLYDPGERIIKIYVISLVISIIIVGVFAYFLLSNQTGFGGINTTINEDFWFEGDNLYTSEGWTFTMTKIKDYTLEGLVIGLKTYYKSDAPYDPCNIFSPIDLAIGTEEIMTNPDKFDYSITSFNNRCFTWYLSYDDVSDYYYFRSHTGNNHIIPHNQDTLDMLGNVSVNDHVIIEGSLVNLYGTRGGQSWIWNSDTSFGNYACEIILVDSIAIF